MARKGKSTEEIIGFLREAEVRIAQGETAGKICRGAGIWEQTYYKWRRDYGGLKIDQAKRLKELERENERLKKAVSELTLDKQILKEALSGKYSDRIPRSAIGPPHPRPSCRLRLVCPTLRSGQTRRWPIAAGL